MARNTKRAAPMTHKITIRVSDAFYARLVSWRARSNCRTVTELVRAILYRERINWYHRDAAQDALAQEFALIRKELNAIGRNVNQVTRAFHQASGAGKLAQALRTEAEYRMVEDKVNRLLKLMETNAHRWLQK